MSSSIIKISNMALTAIGEPIITSLGEETKSARLADLHYPNVRDSVLRAHPWNSATKRVELSRLEETPSFGFSYFFQLPSDFLRLIRKEYNDREHRIVGRTIMYDETTLKIDYVYRVTDVTEMDELLRHAIAARLAFELSLAMSRSQDRSEYLWRVYLQKLSEARFVDSSEHPPEKFNADQWIDARLGNDGGVFRSISDGTS